MVIADDRFRFGLRHLQASVFADVPPFSKTGRHCMSKIHDPRTKKRLSLKRDHRVLKLAEDGAARATLPLEKAAVHQKVRRAEHAALHAALAAPEDAELAVRETRAASRGRLERIAAVSLAQHLALKAGATPPRSRLTRSSRKATRGVKLRRARTSSARA